MQKSAHCPGCQPACNQPGTSAAWQLGGSRAGQGAPGAGTHLCAVCIALALRRTALNALESAYIQLTGKADMKGKFFPQMRERLRHRGHKIADYDVCL